MASSEKELADKLQQFYLEFSGVKFSSRYPLKIRRVVFATKSIDRQKDPQGLQYTTKNTLFIKKDLFFDKDLLECLLRRWIAIHILHGGNGFSETVAELANAIVTAQLRKNSDVRKKWINLWKTVSKEYYDQESKKIVNTTEVLPPMFEKSTFKKTIAAREILNRIKNTVKGPYHQLELIYILIAEKSFSDLTKKQFEYLKAIIKHQSDNQERLAEILRKNKSTINPQIKFLRDNYYYIKKKDLNYSRMGLAHYNIIFATDKNAGENVLPMNHPFITRKTIISDYIDIIFLQMLVPVTTKHDHGEIRIDASNKIQDYLKKVKDGLENKGKGYVFIGDFLEDHSRTMRFQNIDLWDVDEKKWKNPMYIPSENSVIENKLPSFEEFEPKNDVLEKEWLEYINEIMKLKPPTDEEIKNKKGWSHRKINKIKDNIIKLQLIRETYLLPPSSNLIMMVGFLNNAKQNEKKQFESIVSKMFYGSLSPDKRGVNKLFFTILFPSEYLQDIIYWLRFLFMDKIRFIIITKHLGVTIKIPVEHFDNKEWVFPKITIP